MPTLDDYYQACEDALRCQAQDYTLGVYAYLARAAGIRDVLMRQARARLEFHCTRGILDYWEATLQSLPYCREKAHILLDDEAEKCFFVDTPYTMAHTSTLGVAQRETPEDPNDWKELPDPQEFVIRT